MLSVRLLGLVLIRVRCVTKFVVKLSIADFALKCDAMKYEEIKTPLKLSVTNL